ncbi:MAG: class I SAM-dependent methyltransferase [Anaerolineae bacterium]|nr:class I SAM-dependent methyltransferase [Anaerolineae bacterium]
MTSNDIHRYYNQGKEQGRLLAGSGQLEEARTREIVLRYLPAAPATVLDIGGGAGVYALWLARQGYEVHLVDLVPLHVEQALAASAQQPEHPIASARVGDAREVEFPDASADVVLLLGPLYHLHERDERLRVLREAYRLLKPSGTLIAAGISRFASLLDGLGQGFLADDKFATLVERDLHDGRHENPTSEPGYFTTAYFHYPTDLASELTEAGFQHETTLPVEGPMAFMPDFERFWNDAKLRERLLHMMRLIEHEPAMLATTGHLIAVGRK